MSNARINLISGPRNISTALMYSFASRSDTMVVDEPMYAYYLSQVDIDHPGQDEIMKALPKDIETVLSSYFFQDIDSSYLFIKGMAHHYEGLEDLSFLHELKNVFLIRNPKQLIASFAQVIENPTIRDIGLKHEFELFSYLIEQKVEPIVINSAQILEDPKGAIVALCHRLGLPFDRQMLHWSAGPKPYDGVWAHHWYENVWRSTGFKKQATSKRPFPDHLMPLLEEANYYYDQLSNHIITT